MGTRKALTGFKRCPDRTCGMCPFTGNAADGNKLITEVKIKHTGKTIPIREQLSCDTRNCLYICTCVACFPKLSRNEYKGQYIGQTGRKVRDRWGEHRRSTEDPDTTNPVGVHFQERGHNGAEDCTIIPFMRIKSRDPFVRLLMERKAISDCDLIDNGLNQKLG